ncbi:hypothetical protein L1887_62000 [Cichorium endivia]|nr:hypothetical protein L1887_62000 [Cichorium endivia]
MRRVTGGGRVRKSGEERRAEKWAEKKTEEYHNQSGVQWGISQTAAWQQPGNLCLDARDPRCTINPSQLQCDPVGIVLHNNGIGRSCPESRHDRKRDCRCRREEGSGGAKEKLAEQKREREREVMSCVREGGCGAKALEQCPSAKIARSASSSSSSSPRDAQNEKNSNQPTAGRALLSSTWARDRACVHGPLAPPHSL